MFVARDMLRTAHESKPNVLPTVSAWRKPITVNACNVVRFRVLVRMNYPVDSRTAHFLPWLEKITYSPGN